MARIFGAFVDLFCHRDIGDRELDLWARAEYKEDWEWAKTFYKHNNRFPTNKEYLK